MATITKRKFFYINSRNRISGTDSNFSYNLEMNKNEEYDHAVVLQCSIPKSYYLIETGYNTFILKEGIVETTVTVPVGNYNRDSFKTLVQTLLNTASPNLWTYTVTYPNTRNASDTGKFTFTVSGNGGSQPQLIFTDACFEVLGFDENSTNTFVADSLTSSNVIKLQSEDTLYIHSDLISNGEDNILQEIYANGDPSYSSINYQCTAIEAYGKVISTKGSNIYNFYLTNEDDQAIDLNGLNLNITLLLYKQNDIYDLMKLYLKYLIEKT